ncbi:MAG: hypothetical protein GY805_23530 [Chloroflexi bacterium]|nr:hypothetical protein [Chloroflexota bacterium]
MMKSDQMNELFILHSMTNDPINYEGNDKTQGGTEKSKVMANLISRLYKALSEFFTSAIQIGRFRFS